MNKAPIRKLTEMIWNVVSQPPQPHDQDNSTKTKRRKKVATTSNNQQPHNLALPKTLSLSTSNNRAPHLPSFTAFLALGSGSSRWENKIEATNLGSSTAVGTQTRCHHPVISLDLAAQHHGFSQVASAKTKLAKLHNELTNDFQKNSERTKYRTQAICVTKLCTYPCLDVPCLDVWTHVWMCHWHTQPPSGRLRSWICRVNCQQWCQQWYSQVVRADNIWYHICLTYGCCQICLTFGSSYIW